MELITKAHGKINVPEDHLITIPEGLFGFEEYTKYALVDSDYETDIDDDSLKKIGITKPEDIIIMTIVTVPHDGSTITANFQGPLVINKKNHECMQAILNDNRWSTKVDIVQALNKKGGQ